MTREEQIREAAYSRYCNDSSVTFGLQCDCFEKGAQWADKTIIKKACEWLIENYQTNDGGELYVFIKDFKKAMEEQL